MAKKKDVEEVQKTASVKFKVIEENWSEYSLPDGAILRVRPIIVDVEKNPNIKGPNGEPTYQIKGSMIMDVKQNPK